MITGPLVAQAPISPTRTGLPSTMLSAFLIRPAPSARADQADDQAGEAGAEQRARRSRARTGSGPSGRGSSGCSRGCRAGSPAAGAGRSISHDDQDHDHDQHRHQQLAGLALELVPAVAERVRSAVGSAAAGWCRGRRRRRGAVPTLGGRRSLRGRRLRRRRLRRRGRGGRRWRRWRRWRGASGVCAWVLRRRRCAFAHARTLETPEPRVDDPSRPTSPVSQTHKRPPGARRGAALWRYENGGSALDLAADEGLDRGATLVVGALHRRGLHQVRRRREDRATDAAVLGDLRGADRVDDDAGGVGGVPDLELVLEVQRDVTEGATLEADVGPLAVVEPLRRSRTGRCARCGRTLPASGRSGSR